MSKKGSNNDIPTELTIHYIVKDYRRMFHEREKLIHAIKVLKDALEEKDDKAEKRILQLSREVENLKTKHEAVRKEYEQLKKKCARKPDGSSVRLTAYSNDACSLLFFGSGGMLTEHRLSVEDITILRDKLTKYLNGLAEGEEADDSGFYVV